MVRTGKRRTRRKLEPLIPEAPDELNLPKYFNIIRSGGYGGAKSGEKRSEEMLPPMPGPNETPKALRIRRSLLPRDPYPDPAPEPERLPLLARLKYHFVSLFKVEPERPVPMPKVPELNFPALYTRFPVMKTVTKTTDGAGEIAVTYGQSYKTIPGVVISVKDPDNVFGTVFSTTLTGFGVRLFKMDHNHGGVVDDDGLHTPTINADGNHAHEVTGSISWTEDSKYGFLVMSKYTDYEKDHVHTQAPTYYEDAHVHTNPNTSSVLGHTHSNPNTETTADHAHTNPNTGGPSSTYTGVSSIYFGSACVDGNCVTNAYTHSYADNDHTHSVGSTGFDGSHYHVQGVTGSAGGHDHSIGNTGGVTYPGHRHNMPSTGGIADPGHRHLISDDTLYEHYMTGISDVDVSLLVTADESPYHAHSGVEIVKHGHGVAADGRVLLVNTNVTITYIAQEESS